jgi:hypothetical protein
VINMARPAAVEPGVIELGETAAQAIHGLNHRTRGQHTFTEPAELHRLLAELVATASGLPQLLGQLDRWLRHQHDMAALRADTDEATSDIVSRASGHLTCASHAAHDLAHALDAAHQHTAHLATATPHRRNTDEPNQGVNFHP